MSTPPCVVQCIGLAATQNGCAGINDVACHCTNAQVYVDISLCLAQHCSAADQATAQTLYTSHCSAAGLTLTGPVSPTPKPVAFTSTNAASGTNSGSTSTSGTIIALATSNTLSSTSGSPQAAATGTSSPNTGTGGLDSATQLKIGVGVGLSGLFLLLLLLLSYKLYQRTKSGRSGKLRHPDFDHQ